MKTAIVKDIMIPLDQYATVPDTATVREGIRVLREARSKYTDTRHMPRAVLVVDQQYLVIGQVGHLNFLEALEPKYRLLGDLDTLSKAGVSNELINSIIENQRFWHDDFDDVCRRAGAVKVVDIMTPVGESIDEMACISEAIHKMVMCQSMRMTVLRGGDAVGIVRLADLFDSVAKRIEYSEE